MSNIPILEYWKTKAAVFDTLESAHWYLVYTANGIETDRDNRLEAACVIDNARRQLLEESQYTAIKKHKPVRTIKLLDPVKDPVNNTYKEKY